METIIRLFLYPATWLISHGIGMIDTNLDPKMVALITGSAE